MWSFLNPFFLWAGAAAVVPLILHLLQRRRTVRVRFSTIRFLKLAQKRSASRVRLENFLLWLVRTALLLLLALAFALPVLRTRGWAGLMGHVNRDVAIVWDVSYSMGYESGSRRTWDVARDTVAGLVQGLSQGDRVCIFLADDDVTPLIEQPTSDLDLARSLIKVQEPRTGSSQLLPATLAAVKALQNSGTREREVYLVTDGQALPWTRFRGGAGAPGEWNPKTLDQGLSFFVALIGAGAPQNASPVSVEVQPMVLLTNTAPQLAVKVQGTGPAQDTAVAVYVDDQELGRRSVSLTAAHGEEAVFALPPLSAGTHFARVETPADGLPIDNAFYFLLRVREQLPVLCVGSEVDTFFLERALNPRRRESAAADSVAVAVSGINSKRIEPDALGAETLSDYSAVFLCNAVPVPGQVLLDLENYVRRGGLLVVFPGDRGAVADYGSWSCLPSKPVSIDDAGSEPVRQALRLLKPHDPPFGYLKLPLGTVPAVSIRRQLHWGPLEHDAEPVIGLGDRPSFLLQRTFGNGRVLEFAVSADRRWSDLPLSPFFLPIVHQMVEFGAGASRERLSQWTGKNLVLSDLVPEAVAGASLLGPKQEPVPIRRLKRDNRETLEVDRLAEPGIYRLSRPSTAGAEPVLALNVPRNESDLTPVDHAEVPAILNVHNLSVATDTEELFRQIEEHRLGRPMHESLLWVVFALALLELFLANRLSRRATTVTDGLSIQASGRVLSRAA